MDAVTLELANNVVERCIREPQYNHGWDARPSFYIDARERLIDKIRCISCVGIESISLDRAIPFRVRFIRVLISAFGTNAMDRAFLPLPNALSLLYFLVRPIRLIAKYTSSPSRIFAIVGCLTRLAFATKKHDQISNTTSVSSAAPSSAQTGQNCRLKRSAQTGQNYFRERWPAPIRLRPPRAAIVPTPDPRDG
jgi:hypothetical protein